MSNPAHYLEDKWLYASHLELALIHYEELRKVTREQQVKKSEKHGLLQLSS